MNRLFSPLPAGIYHLTATVSGTTIPFSTTVPVIEHTVPPGSFYATFPGATVGTINTMVTFVLSILLTANIASLLLTLLLHPCQVAGFHPLQLAFLKRRNMIWKVF